MKKRIIALLIATSLLICACGNNTAPSVAPTADTTEKTTSTVAAIPEESISTTTLESVEEEPVPESTVNDLSELEALGDIKVESELFSVTLTIPVDFAGDVTQEELNATCEEIGYKSATLNEDGSITYVMKPSQHKEMMNELRNNLNQTLNELVGSEDYPTFTAISTNDDFTTFTITTTSTELDLNEAFSVMIFYMYGGMYSIFNGTEVDNIHVDFVNADTGEIISSSDSSAMGE